MSISFKNQWIILDNILDGFTCERCRISFTGKPNIIRNAVFVDCVFDMPTTGDPNPFLKEASRQILSSLGRQRVSLSVG